MHAVDSFGPWQSAGFAVRIDFTRRAALTAERDGRVLRALPAAVRAGGDYAWMKVALEAAREHQRGLQRLVETAMVEAIPLEAEDLAVLALDPAGRPLLERLLFTCGTTPTAQQVGRPLPDEWLLETRLGDLAPLAAPARVVHPTELQRAGTLDDWDRWLNRQPHPQPVKQIRREVFLPPTEDCTFSTAFAGEVVRWDQARALLDGRGWYRVTRAGAERNFRRAALTFHLEFRTPATRGWSRERVLLHRLYVLPLGENCVNEERPGLSLHQVPVALYSEAMRDAHFVARVAGERRRT